MAGIKTVASVVLFCFSVTFARNSYPPSPAPIPFYKSLLFQKMLAPSPVLDSTRVLSFVDEVHGTRPSDLPRTLTGKGILIGVIDTEFDTHHPAFLDQDGKTRFVALWNQNAVLPGKPNRFGYGVIKNHKELQEDSLFGLVENHVHGTMMASIAAGSEKTYGFYGMAPDAMIAAVMYSTEISNISDGISWIFSLADSINVPCVVNLSIGVSYGPHDGTSLFDRFVDSVSGPGRIIVGAAGNDYNRRAHLQFKLAPNDSQGTCLTPKLATSDSDTFYYSGIDIWGEKSKFFSLQPLFIDTSTREMKYFKKITFQNATKEYEDSLSWENTDGSTDIARMFIRAEPSSNLNNKPHALIYYQATKPSLFAGVTIQNGKDNCNIHAWHVHKEALRKLDIDGFHGGNAEYSINEVGGTAKRIISTGAYIGRATLKYWNDSVEVSTDKKGDIAHFSGAGPTVDGRIKPEITAPGWRLVSAISRSSKPDLTPVIWPDISRKTGRYAEATGTSGASPVVAGIIALMLQINPNLTPETALECIQKSAIHDQWTGDITSPINQWGAGKINAEGAIKEVLDLYLSIRVSRNEVPSPVSFTHSGHSVFIRNFHQKGSAVLFNLQGRRIARINFSENGIVTLPRGISAGLFTIAFYRQDGSFIGNHKIAVDR
ncbi:MAG: S8 family serine peptidase [Fibrobacter sp.]|nr:S8 family serine peptidase [Fibrobacter sp.]